MKTNSEPFERPQLLAMVMGNLPGSVIVVDHDGMIQYWNNASSELFGYQQDEILHKPLIGLCALEEDLSVAELQRALQTGNTTVHWVAKSKNGTNIRIHTELKRFYEPSGQAEWLVCASSESSKHALDELQNIQQELRALLEQKEILIKEIHHRVRNNLQIISSLLSLQEVQGGTQARDLLRKTRSRIRAISLVYDRLFHSDNLARIDLAEYVKDLLNTLLVSYRIQNKTIKSVLDCKRVLIDPDRAVYAGLMINEIVSNSLHHAFLDLDTGVIHASCLQENNTIHINLSDNGISLPEKFVTGHPESLGLQLIRLLADQLGAEIEIDRNGGTRFHIKMDARSKKELNLPKIVTVT